MPCAGAASAETPGAGTWSGALTMMRSAVVLEYRMDWLPIGRCIHLRHEECRLKMHWKEKRAEPVE